MQVGEGRGMPVSVRAARYLDLEGKVVAAEGEGDDAESVEH